MPEARPAAAAARPWEIEDDNGVTVLGWAVRQDTLVTLAGGLQEPLTAIREGKRITAQIVHHESGLGEGVGWTGLELPLGTIPMTGEAYPPQLMKSQSSGGDFPQGAQAPAPNGGSERNAVAAQGQSMVSGTSFWCKVFPKMKGCR